MKFRLLALVLTWLGEAESVVHGYRRVISTASTSEPMSLFKT